MRCVNCRKYCVNLRSKEIRLIIFGLNSISFEQIVDCIGENPFQDPIGFPFFRCTSQKKSNSQTDICVTFYSFQGDSEQAAGNESKHNKCVFCKQTLEAKDIPKLLECLHVCCNSCITAKFDEIDRSQPAMVHCPDCNMASQADKIILNQFLIEASEASADDALASVSDPDAKAVIKCSSCTDDETATSWCVECSEYICDSCVQAHQRLKITKDHTIKTKEEAFADNQSITTEEKSLMCHVHLQVSSNYIPLTRTQSQKSYFNVFCRKNFRFFAKRVTN